jgi:hypothetical protein
MTTLQIIRLNESAPAMAHGFRYNVQIWTKDSGRGWCYAGNGKFLKTAGEVLSYGKEHADFYSADMYKDFYACMSEEDVVYFVGVYKWHAFRVYPDEKITKATEQEGELAGKWLEREKGKR